MSDTNAIPPTSDISYIYQRMKDQKQEVVAELYNDDETWAALAESPAYRLLKAYITDLKKALEALDEKAIMEGASVTEIGMRTYVRVLTRDSLDSIINKVELSRDAIRKQRGLSTPTPTG